VNSLTEFVKGLYEFLSSQMTAGSFCWLHNHCHHGSSPKELQPNLLPVPDPSIARHRRQSHSGE